MSDKHSDMFADRLLKPRPARKPSLMMERLRELGKWLAEPMPPKEFSEDWYVGLAVEPTKFTEQLMRLQDSLRTAGSESVAPVPVPVRQRAN